MGAASLLCLRCTVGRDGVIGYRQCPFPGGGWARSIAARGSHADRGTHESAERLKQAIERYEIDTLLTTLNPVSRRKEYREDLLPAANERRLGVIAMSEEMVLKHPQLEQTRNLLDGGHSAAAFGRLRGA